MKVDYAIGVLFLAARGVCCLVNTQWQCDRGYDTQQCKGLNTYHQVPSLGVCVWGGGGGRGGVRYGRQPLFDLAIYHSKSLALTTYSISYVF